VYEAIRALEQVGVLSRVSMFASTSPRPVRNPVQRRCTEPGRWVDEFCDPRGKRASDCSQKRPSAAEPRRGSRRYFETEHADRRAASTSLMKRLSAYPR